MFNLRWYQREAVTALYEYFHNGGAGNPLVCIPTGGGKSLIIAEFCRIFAENWPGKKIVVLTHTKKLVEQNAACLNNHAPHIPYGINSAELKQRDFHSPIIFGTIQSVYKDAEKFGFVAIVFVDEAHLVSYKENSMYRLFFNGLMRVNPNLRVVGDTATPYRLGTGRIIDEYRDAQGKTQKPIFMDICYDITTADNFNRLIAEGYLSPLTTRATEFAYDLEGVRVRGGDYDEKSLHIAMDKNSASIAAIEEVCRLGEHRKHWLVFGSGIAHCEHLKEIFAKYNIAADIVHSKQKPAEREAVIQRFMTGELRALINNNILTTGFDFPAIDLIVMLRPTQSQVLWRQMIGRGLRIAEGKTDCLVLDFVRNIERLGAVNMDYTPPKKRGGGGMAPVKACPCCRTYTYASAKFCTAMVQSENGPVQCGYQFPEHNQINNHASGAAIIDGEVPKTEILPVSDVVYSIHNKPGKPTSMRVDYYCGLAKFSEWWPFDIGGYAALKSRERWEAAGGEAPHPENTMEAVTRAPIELNVPKSILVWTNKPKYPEILSRHYEILPS